MVENMLFFHEKAANLGLQLAELVVTETDAETRANLVKLVRELLNAREQSQKCAVDAAPYIHAKLASLQISGEAKVTHSVSGDRSHASLTDADLASQYRAALEVAGAVQPEPEFPDAGDRDVPEEPASFL
jgi:hypothetical protein